VSKTVEAVAETVLNREAGTDPVGPARVRAAEVERVAIVVEVESIEAGVAVEVVDPRVAIESSTSKGQSSTVMMMN
jgi:malic enzyme